MATHPEADIQDILALGQDMTVASLLPDGAPHASTVSYASEGLRIYFGCSPASQKAQNLARDDRVAITITLPYRDWGEIRGLTLQGRARRLPPGADADRAGLLFLQKFSEIAQYVSADGGDGGDELALFEVTPTNVVVLDYRQGFGHVTRTRLGATAEA